MISLIEQQLPNISGDEPTAGRLLAWWNAYRDTNIARFYKTEHDGCIAVLDAQAIVCAPKEDGEEITTFFEWQQDVRSIYTTIPLDVDGKVKDFTAMLAPTVGEANEPLSVSLQALYTFLQLFFEDLPPFEPWYLDTSYRTRHNLCRHTAIVKDGYIVSTAMTVAEWDGGALLGGVATSEAHRRRGYAAQCVLSLTFALQKMGKRVWICPYNQPAEQLYASLGFENKGTVTVIERK